MCQGRAMTSDRGAEIRRDHTIVSPTPRDRARPTPTSFALRSGSQTMRTTRPGRTDAVGLAGIDRTFRYTPYCER